jgi:hypothetical protein
MTELASVTFTCDAPSCKNILTVLETDKLLAYLGLVDQGWRVKAKSSGSASAPGPKVYKHFCPDHRGDVENA